MTRIPLEQSTQLVQSAAMIIAQLAGEGVRSVIEITAGVMTYKYQVTSQSGDAFIVRFYPSSRSFVPEYEPDILRRCRAHGIRVPEVVADSRSGPEAPLGYVVYRMLPGISLQECLEGLNPRNLRSICHDIVVQLEELADLPMIGFGDVLSDQCARSASWHDFVRDAFDQGLEMARSQSVLEPPLSDALESIRSRLNRFTGPAAPSLAWGDLSPENIIVDANGSFVGLVDFEGVVAAEIDLGLGFLRARYGGTAFCNEMTYNWPPSRSGEPRVGFYVIVRALRLLRHGRKPLPTGLARDPIDVFLPNLRAAVNEVYNWVGQSSVYPTNK